jgi:hypothetical protein
MPPCLALQLWTWPLRVYAYGRGPQPLLQPLAHAAPVILRFFLRPSFDGPNSHRFWGAIRNAGQAPEALGQLSATTMPV